MPDPIGLAVTLHDQVKQWTGIPVSVGIGRTKTLAKVANQDFRRRFHAFPGRGESRSGYTSCRQGVLFDSPFNDKKRSELLQEIHERFGKNKLVSARTLVGQATWAMNQSRRTPAYTTRWSEIPVVS